MKTYKGFDKDFKCIDFQFEVGKTYEIEGEIKCCEKGFHACENPLDIFNYYPPTKIFAECESDGIIDKKEDDTKLASSKITINAEINLFKLCKIGVKYILNKVNWKDNKESNTGYQSAAANTGNRSAATNTGYQSAAANTGYRSAATNTGYQSAAIVEGKDSIACGLGYKNKSKGKKGNWIVLAERDNEGHILTVCTTKIDGEIIKEDVFYYLINGEFVEEN